ncbi:delta(3,5)-Delta(2,4)-dienoyl-CoA isomerase, peroxisomal-like [Macadamia integrifolia]|uniref:delta(3,5)-Delta(2,4)-dienoyl-CoA isomerase, peroxisomal-like n=1 Tax=Macadamia integrifolia TaxID=60698 RepID=UPI001C4F0688|nr:delta(3,5)-Delta(2,4)-dienoyl-CoA isomerase, peroxisomal-like [Macadamia integrifolia]
MRIAGVAGERCKILLCFIQISFTVKLRVPCYEKRGIIEKKGLHVAIIALEICGKPVIAGIHGSCIGGGIDIVTACDVRYCTKDSFFSVKEVDLAVIADLGMLQRLPAIVGFGNAMELALTSRKLLGPEASRKEGWW